MSETKKYRKFTAQQNARDREILLTSDRENYPPLIADSLLRKWREQFLAAGAERLQGKRPTSCAPVSRSSSGR